MTIEDTIEGHFRCAEGRFHIHPSLRPVVVGETILIGGMPSGREVRVSCERGTLELQPSTWHPAFGSSVPSYCIVARFAGASICTHVEW
jgi:hypothetical protein